VLIFFEINEYLAKMMTKLTQYSYGRNSSYSKLDAPSGTAISLAKESLKIVNIIVGR
jgi:4-hydroxy-tetrahydrodipicolinate reductase